MGIKESKQNLEELKDIVEKDYVDPLKDKVDEYSKKPLSWLEKNGRKAVLYFTIGVTGIAILMAVLTYVF